MMKVEAYLYASFYILFGRLNNSASHSWARRLSYARRNAASSCRTYVVPSDIQLGSDSVRDTMCLRRMRLRLTSAVLRPLVFVLLLLRHHRGRTYIMGLEIRWSVQLPDIHNLKSVLEETPPEVGILQSPCTSCFHV